jgi:hypothetical protein
MPWGTAPSQHLGALDVPSNTTPVAISCPDAARISFGDASLTPLACPKGLQRREPPSGFASRLRRETLLQRWSHRNALAPLQLLRFFKIQTRFL